MIIIMHSIQKKNKEGMSKTHLSHYKEITTLMIDKGGNDPKITELVQWSK